MAPRFCAVTVSQTCFPIDRGNGKHVVSPFVSLSQPPARRLLLLRLNVSVAVPQMRFDGCGQADPWRLRRRSRSQVMSDEVTGRSDNSLRRLPPSTTPFRHLPKGPFPSSGDRAPSVARLRAHKNQPHPSRTAILRPSKSEIVLKARLLPLHR